MASPDPASNPSDGHWYPQKGLSDADLTKKIKKDIAKTSKKAKKSSAVQPCPYAPKPKQEPKEKTCTFHALKIVKEERGYDLIVEHSTPNNKRTLEIVAGHVHHPAKVSFELEGPVGPCPTTHNNKRSFDSGGGTYNILPKSTENALEVELISSTLVRLNPWSVVNNKYTISANRCGHAGEFATIIVFPMLKFDLYIGWDFGKIMGTSDDKTDVEIKKGNRKGAAAHKRHEVAVVETTNSKEKTREISKGLIVGGSIEYDGKEYVIEKVFEKTFKTVEKITGIVTKAKVALDKVRGIQAAATSKNAEESSTSSGIWWPNIKLHLGGRWNEDKGKPTVSYEGKIKLEGRIIGFHFAWNITKTVLNSMPVGRAFNIIKEKLGAGILELVLTAGFDLNADVSMFIKNKKIDRVEGKVEGKIPIGAELTVVKAEVDRWFVHATVDVKVGVESGFRVGLRYEPHEEVLLCTGGMLDFVVWWSRKIECGGAEKDNKENPYKKVSAPEKSSESKSVLYRKVFEDENFYGEFEKSEKRLFKLDPKTFTFSKYE